MHCQNSQVHPDAAPVDNAETKIKKEFFVKGKKSRSTARNAWIFVLSGRFRGIPGSSALEVEEHPADAAVLKKAK
jgi:hypothetical protein